MSSILYFYLTHSILSFCIPILPTLLNLQVFLSYPSYSISLYSYLTHPILSFCIPVLPILLFYPPHLVQQNYLLFILLVKGHFILVKLWKMRIYAFQSIKSVRRIKVQIYYGGMCLILLPLHRYWVYSVLKTSADIRRGCAILY